VETVDGVTQEELANEIIPKLEEAMLNALLPSIATGCSRGDDESGGVTGGTSTTGVDAETASSTGIEGTDVDVTADGELSGTEGAVSDSRQGSVGAVGFSISPSDTTLTGVACQEDEANCVVVDGAMTLFGDNLSDDVNSTLALLQILMENGAFDDVDDRIVKVRYRDVTVVEPNPVGPTTVDDAGGGVDDVPNYAWVLIAVGAAMLLALCCACPFPCGKDDDDDEEELKQNATEADMLTADDPLANHEVESVSVEA